MNRATTCRAMLLVCVTQRGRGEEIVAQARKAGASGGTILLARGSARTRWLQLLGLADTRRDVVFIGAFGGWCLPSIIGRLKSAMGASRTYEGIGFVIDVTSFLRPSQVMRDDKAAIKAAESGGDDLKATSHVLICAIVNAGLADDLMHEARLAGARGGTILRARGTATSEDSSFFGISIVPEKEVLLVLAERGKSDAIAGAIAGAKCLAEPGSGVVFRMPVEQFFQLGAKSAKS